MDSYINAFEQDNYQDASKAKNKLSKCKHLGLTEEQTKTVEEWIDSIHAESAAYSMVVFSMGMQCCFTLIMHLADLK